MQKLVIEIPIYGTSAEDLEEDVAMSLSFNGWGILDSHIEQMNKSDIRLAVMTGILPREELEYHDLDTDVSV